MHTKTWVFDGDNFTHPVPAVLLLKEDILHQIWCEWYAKLTRLVLCISLKVRIYNKDENDYQTIDVKSDMISCQSFSRESSSDNFTISHCRCLEIGDCTLQLMEKVEELKRIGIIIENIESLSVTVGRDKNWSGLHHE